MLKGINKLLTGDLLKALCDMGHGDVVAIVDANYPAHTMAKKLISYPGISATDLLRAIAEILPLDHISVAPALLMEMEPEDRNSGMDEPAIWSEFTDIIRREYGKEKKVGKISRQEYYDMSKEACLIIQTGEERLYGDIILVKGVL